MSSIEIEYNHRNSKFTMFGKEALGYASNKKSLTLSQQEIMQIVELYKKGVLSEMLHDPHTPKNGVRTRTVRTDRF